MSMLSAAHFLLPAWHILLLTVNNLLFACMLCACRFWVFNIYFYACYMHYNRASLLTYLHIDKFDLKPKIPKLFFDHPTVI